VQYMMLIYLDEKALSEAEREECYLDSAQYAHKLEQAGKYLLAAPLQPASTATSVRVRDRQPLVTAGPFAETHEQLGGFFLVEARDLNEAIEIAAQIPAGRWGTVEIRPVIEVPSLPEKSPAPAVESEPARSTY